MIMSSSRLTWTNSMPGRIQAVLRRSAMTETNTATAEIRTHNLLIDLARRRVLVEGEDIHLTPKEYELLRLLATNPGKVLTYSTLLTAASNSLRSRRVQVVTNP